MKKLITLTLLLLLAGVRQSNAQVPGVSLISGAIKKVIVNGQEQAPPDPNDVQIISENKASVTVPAGAFPNCIDVKAHIKSQNTDEEMWIDPTNVPVAGLVKLAASSQGIPITGELTKITHGTGLN